MEFGSAGKYETFQFNKQITDAIETKQSSQIVQFYSSDPYPNPQTKNLGA